VPVLGVIEPACRRAVSVTKKGKVGVIGTRATVESRSYEKTLKRIDKAITVFSKACPLFVPIVEEGLCEHDVAYLMAERYLGEIREKGIDVLILGCTHYPMLEHVIRDTMGGGIEIVNPGLELAREVRSILEKERLERENGRGAVKFFVTDDPQNFKRIGEAFLGHPIGDVRLVRNLFPS
jgi:glutamate racemase